ncbi:hypothetical protein F4804DRAFT_349094, partial [Jackrogersella minutella]
HFHYSYRNPRGESTVHFPQRLTVHIPRPAYAAHKISLTSNHISPNSIDIDIMAMGYNSEHSHSNISYSKYPPESPPGGMDFILPHGKIACREIYGICAPLTPETRIRSTYFLYSPMFGIPERQIQAEEGGSDEKSEENYTVKGRFLDGLPVNSHLLLAYAIVSIIIMFYLTRGLVRLLE